MTQTRIAQTETLRERARKAEELLEKEAAGRKFGVMEGLSEDLKIQAGKVQNPNFTNYHIMTAPEMPEIVTHYVETDDPFGPYGAKGIGEAPAICVAPAVANAIHNATGMRLTALPFTPQRVLFALKAEDTK